MVQEINIIIRAPELMVNCQNGNLEKIIASGFFISLYYELQDISGLECFIINYAN